MEEPRSTKQVGFVANQVLYRLAVSQILTVRHVLVNCEERKKVIDTDGVVLACLVLTGRRAVAQLLEPPHCGRVEPSPFAPVVHAAGLSELGDKRAHARLMLLRPADPGRRQHPTFLFRTSHELIVLLRGAEGDVDSVEVRVLLVSWPRKPGRDRMPGALGDVFDVDELVGATEVQKDDQNDVCVRNGGVE